jgi:hypothetical protein
LLHGFTVVAISFSILLIISIIRSSIVSQDFTIIYPTSTLPTFLYLAIFIALSLSLSLILALVSTSIPTALAFFLFVASISLTISIQNCLSLLPIVVLMLLQTMSMHQGDLIVEAGIADDLVVRWAVGAWRHGVGNMWVFALWLRSIVEISRVHSRKKRALEIACVAIGKGKI